MPEDRRLQPFVSVPEEVCRLFQELIHQPWGCRSLPEHSLRQPHVDMCETAEAMIVEVELPGVRREDIHIEIEGDVLHIRLHHDLDHRDP